MNPAREVKTERFSRTEGKTPAFVDGEVNTLLSSIDIFEVLITGSFQPGHELLDCAVVGQPRILVADRNREKLEKLFPG